jgi:hypothetical protein
VVKLVRHKGTGNHFALKMHLKSEIVRLHIKPCACAQSVPSSRSSTIRSSFVCAPRALP